MLDKDGPRPLSNFSAEITQQINLVDGDNTTVIYEIEGADAKGKKLSRVTVNAEEYATLAWVGKSWGHKALILPGGANKDHLRAAIHVLSNPKTTTTYTHTGWTTKDTKKREWVTPNGRITAKGFRPDTTTSLPKELMNTAAAEPLPVDQCRTILRSLADSLPTELSATLIPAAFRPPIRPVDFALHMAGRTGTFKSEIAAIIQSFYGNFDARNLPANWSSTPNAIEALAYRAKDMVMVVDDFIPAGTAWQQRAYQKAADQIIRGQGNQAGRARLTDVSSLQETMYPRGMVFSTGEDIPEGHSIRARCWILELSPGLVSPQQLTKAQSLKPKLKGVMSSFLRWLIAHPEEPQEHKDATDRYRDQYLSVGHSRTPSTIGQLLATVDTLQKWLGTKLNRKAWESHIIDTGEQQMQHLTAADPVDTFVSTIRMTLNTHLAHIAARGGGIPKDAEHLGWTKEESTHDIPVFKRHGKLIGWADSQQGLVYIDINMYDWLKRQARGDLTLTRNTMYKRLKDAGLLAITDDSRGRNTTRVKCGGLTRTCLALKKSTILEPETEFDE